MNLSIDLIDVSEFGLIVLNSQGELDFPKIKRPLSYNWPDEDGLAIDLTSTLKEPKEIVIDFLIQASSISELEENLYDFQQLIQSPGLHIFKYDYINKPLFLYSNENISIEQLTGVLADIIEAKFSLKLIEPNPEGRYFIYDTSSDADFEITGNLTEKFIVDWGDQSQSICYAGNIIQHTYDSSITYTYVAVFGIVSKMLGLSTNLTEITT